mmetsp:Transcript_34072/g.73752  ORF Transcript_34072/g.73752 Transcript_34072/m.73752 type:complete len:201 (+) Transcript_34072:126-728(+)
MPQFSAGGFATLSSNHSKFAGQRPKHSNASKVDISSTTFSPSCCGNFSSSLTSSLGLSRFLPFATAFATAFTRSALGPESPGMSSSRGSSIAPSIPRRSSWAISRARDPTASCQAGRVRLGCRARPVSPPGEGRSGGRVFRRASCGSPMRKSSAISSRHWRPLTACWLWGSPSRVARRRKALSAKVTARPPLCCEISEPC